MKTKQLLSESLKNNDLLLFSAMSLSLGSIFTQLHGYKRKKSEGFAGLSADNLSDFLRELPKACRPHEPTSVIVLDNVHWLSRSPLLRALLQAREHCHGGASIAFVMISQQAWGCGEFADLPSSLPMIHFPSYSRDQLVTVLTKFTPMEINAQIAQRQFLEHVIAAFHDTTRDLLDLATVANHLWPRFFDPIISRKLNLLEWAPGDLTKKLLTASFIKHIQTARQVFEPGMRQHQLARSMDRHLLHQAQVPGFSSSRVSQEQMLELPEMTRLLLVAAYIVAQNKPTLDKQVFDVKAKSGRARSRMDSDRQVEAAKESRLKGPHTFPLQRLLTCLSHLQSGREVHELELKHGGGRVSSSSGLYATPDDSSSSITRMFREREERSSKRLRLGMDIDFTCGTNDDEEDEGDIIATSPTLQRRRRPWWKRERRDRAPELGAGSSDIIAPSGPPREGGDLFAHLHTLTRMQLLSSSDSDSSDVFDGAKYSCHVTEEYASSLASSLGLRLTDYVKYV